MKKPKNQHINNVWDAGQAAPGRKFTALSASASKAERLSAQSCLVKKLQGEQLALKGAEERKQ